MKLPGPEHPITIEPFAGRVVVRLGGEVVADSTSALCLREASYPPTWYVPRADVRAESVRASAHTTYCPYKGDASYWTFVVGDRASADAAWSYEAPYAAVAAIAGHLAFYPDRVDAIETY
ncbi:MAG: DUF427 domain-containing protein [Planctomycetes bacterium]|nr:DUF427 domain-containing protein [Planctomycetota bacterium]